MSVSILEASTEEVDRVGRSRVRVAPSKFVILLGKSSTDDAIVASVVVEVRTISLEVAILIVVASASVLITLTRSVGRL